MDLIGFSWIGSKSHPLTSLFQIKNMGNGLLAIGYLLFVIGVFQLFVIFHAKQKN